MITDLDLMNWHDSSHFGYKYYGNIQIEVLKQLPSSEHLCHLDVPVMVMTVVAAIEQNFETFYFQAPRENNAPTKFRANSSAED